MKTSLLIVGIIAAFSSLSAQQSLPAVNVSIYKNGSAFFTKNGTVPVVNDTAFIPVPNAVIGTYWLTTPKENLIKNISYKSKKITTKIKDGDVRELLRANVGKTVSVSIPATEGKTQTVTGTIVGFYEMMSMVKISDGFKTRLVSFHDIADISLEGINDYFLRDSIVYMAQIIPTKQLTQLEVTETSLQSNISWIPSYYLSLKDDKSARLEMKSLIENYSGEVFNNTNTELIVGMPQLGLGLNPDPATTQGFTHAGGGYNPVMQQSMYANSFKARSMGMMESADALSVAPTSTFAATTETGDDLFIYKLGKISLPKQSKASFPVFATTLSYKNLHECEIADYTNFENMKYIQPNDNVHDVFHSIEITNSTDYPLTSGTIMVTDKDGRFTAQDQLKYVPKNGIGIIRLTKEINISVKNSEEEIERYDNVKKINKVSLNKVKIRGTITINNYDQDSKTITLKKNINGTITVANDGKVTKVSQYYGNNPMSNVTWEITVASGAKKEIVYEYETLFFP